MESDEDEDDNPYIYESYNTSVDGMINLSEHLRSKDFYTLFDDLVVDSDSSETQTKRKKRLIILFFEKLYRGTLETFLIFTGI